jgi:uncharacterized protein YaaR (DUF327 family)
MLTDVLKQQAIKGAELVKEALSKYSATNKTANSVEGKSDDKSFQILAREFIGAIETGRGPRKSSTDGGFKDSMIEWMKARGVGANLSEKNREHLAKFLVLKINRDGDKLHKSGTKRDVYSSVLKEFIKETSQEVQNDMIETHQSKVLDSLKGMK